ncbi:MAG: glycoside hydrolase family 13 protein [Saprospiraceae bacterium]|nr:glycoside hydrolase family 13 protein [Saprospiraceae bacterium]
MNRYYTIVFVLVSGFYTVSGQNIQHIEPPFWWNGMEDPRLQIMVHGKDIGSAQVKVEGDQVSLEKSINVSNPNYKFIDLIVHKNAPEQQVKITFEDPDTVIYYPLKKRTDYSRDRQGFNNSDIIYLITPDRYANGNTDNDNIPGFHDPLNRTDPYGRHGGDIAGLRAKLDHIVDMGYTAIWLNPLLENNQYEQSYHGYATTDYYKVDPRYGTNEDYKNLIAAANEVEVKVIMDMIANHCGSEHWWMEDLPMDDWLNHQGNYKLTNHRRTTHQDPYASKEDTKGMTEGWFVPSMPDLNQRNPIVAKYLIQNTIWWIEYSGIAGIRQDTYPYPDKEFMSDWACAIMKEYPYFNMVGEEWTDNPVIASYWLAGKDNKDGYESCLPSVMDFPMNMTLVKALNESEQWNTGLIRLYEMMVNDVLYPDPMNLVIFPDNHDMSRIYTQLNEDYYLYQNAMAYFLTMRGIPQVYYGTEILMSNKGTDSHGVIRSDYPGGWEGDEVDVFNEEGLNAQQVEALNFNRKLNHWRTSSLPIQYGRLTHYFPKDGVYVYFRHLNQDVVMVVINKRKEASTLEMSSYKEMIGNATVAKDVLNGVDIKLGDKIELPPNVPLILEWSK